MTSTIEARIAGEWILHDVDVLPEVHPHVFDLGWHESQGTLLGHAQGRNRAGFLSFEGHQLVLRPFQRGGAIGKINRDKYLRTGAQGSRAFREYRLLDWMHDQGLSVPRPVAARYAPKGLFYRADIITERIPNARPLADVLKEKALTADEWKGIGQLVRQMHGLGVDHTDLNCRNILFDKRGRASLIDFDKCRRRQPGAWMQSNLDRLKRSLVKEQSLHPKLHWSEDAWSFFVSGYKERSQQNVE